MSDALVVFGDLDNSSFAKCEADGEAWRQHQEQASAAATAQEEASSVLDPPRVAEVVVPALALGGAGMVGADVEDIAPREVHAATAALGQAIFATL